jgi:ABC-2 type transport system ATP-binding protein
MSDAIIKVRDVRKSFEGVDAVQGISFDVPRGKVVGFIGANGAGKTTTMRMMVTLEMPDSGRIEINGFDVVEQPQKVRKLLGWMPDSYGAYAHVTVLDYLDFYARACGYRGADRVRRVKEVMDFADLTPLSDRPMNGLSKGMAQRLCFGRALVQDPEILILDEPAAGLDPKARIEFKNLVQLLARRGTTIFISSHILSELGEMCDALIFIDQGRMLHHGTADELRHREGEGTCIVDLQVHGAFDPLLEWLSIHPGWKLVEQRKGFLRAEFGSREREQLAAELRRMVLDGIAVTDFHRQERRLEDVFVDALRDARPLEPPPLP